jgi:steroid delta-isomerase-like uncharacterized protein
MYDLTNDHRSLIRRIYDEMWNAADPAAAHRLFVQSHSVERFVREFLAAFPDLKHTVQAIVIEGDQAAARFTAHGTHTGKWKELEASQKPIHYTGVLWARLEDGMVAEHHTWWDVRGLIEQIGSASK